MDCLHRLLLFAIVIASFTLAQIISKNSERDISLQSLVIVIVSQPNAYHHDKALRMREDILHQAERIAQTRPTVHLTHVDFPHVGAWTIIPLIPMLTEMHAGNASIVCFLQDATHVNLQRLLNVVEQYENQHAFVGYALHDREPSIIHHFAFFEDPKRFKYPNQASGFFLTMPLLLSLSDRLRKETPQKTDFQIDAAHELALFVWADGNGTRLHHEPAFCARSTATAKCATYPLAFVPCGEPVQKDEIYIAVKTCRKFHADRVRVVESTWARHAKYIKYFSDFADEGIPTVDVGVPNTAHGHCEKTFAILRYVDEDVQRLFEGERVNIKWILLVDDDTILSVSHIMRLLSCYQPEDDVVLGERYGYGVRTRKGYNYVTGGGGTAISRRLLPTLVDRCECPAANSPDDMYLGFCLRELRVSIVHSPLFHQARPNDYPSAYLESHEQDVVSFHKHWMIDPIKVYKTWFEKADRELGVVAHDHHQEL